MDNLDKYSKGDQVDIKEITIKKPGGEVIDIADIMQEIIIHEDVLGGSMSAKLVILDQVNLVGTLPIVGGEDVYIKYKTPVRNEYKELTFKVYRIGDRDLQNDASNIQVNILYLCTNETWWAANNDVGNGIKGTYAEIVDKLLRLSGSEKKLDKEETLGIVTYVSPMWDIFKGINWCATRSNSVSMTPYFFWETAHGYHFKNLKTLYDQAAFKRIYAEDRSTLGTEVQPEKTFNSVYSFEYGESNNRLQQFKDMAFGGDIMTIDPLTKRFTKKNYQYDEFFNGANSHVEGFPLNDDMKDKRSRLSIVYAQADDSQLGAYSRNAAISLMDNVKLMVSIPGDSDLKAGDCLWMEIPVKVGLEIGPEVHTSGKWLVRSLKHLIQRTSYTQICELTKDSFSAAVR